MDEVEERAQAPGSAKSAGRVVVAILVCLLLAGAYVGVLRWYAASTEPDVVTQSDFPTDIDFDTDLIVIVNPTEVHPVEEVVPAQLEIIPPASIAGPAGELKMGVDVLISGVDGGSVEFARGSTASSKPVTIRPQETDFQSYPFDDYQAVLAVAAFTVDADGERQELKTFLGIGGDVPGWDLAAESLPELEEIDDSTALLKISRAGSTIAIVVLILSAMAVLAVAGILVARAVITRHRRIEATMASWFAAMLFAIIPLRTNMPGSPPMGVWIDFVIVLWVELALMVSVALFIASWLRFTPSPREVPQ